MWCFLVVTLTKLFFGHESKGIGYVRVAGPRDGEGFVVTRSILLLHLVLLFITMTDILNCFVLFSVAGDTRWKGKPRSPSTAFLNLVHIKWFREHYVLAFLLRQNRDQWCGQHRRCEHSCDSGWSATCCWFGGREWSGTGAYDMGTQGSQEPSESPGWKSTVWLIEWMDGQLNSQEEEGEAWLLMISNSLPPMRNSCCLCLICGCEEQTDGNLRGGQQGYSQGSSFALPNQGHWVVDYLVRHVGGSGWCSASWVFGSMLSVFWFCAVILRFVLLIFPELGLGFELELEHGFGLASGSFLVGAFAWEITALVLCVCAWLSHWTAWGGEFVTWGILGDITITNRVAQ